MFSLAEINLAPFLARLEYLTFLDLWINDRPAVQAWWRRVKQRPSYRAQLGDLMTADEIEEMQSAGDRIKPRIAELRAEYLAWACPHAQKVFSALVTQRLARRTKHPPKRADAPPL